MRKHLTNAIYGVLDYISYPLGMLLVAPIVLHRLGAAEYGLWMIATAIISAGGIIASGFCDAGLQRVAHLRSESDTGRMVRTIRTMLTINIVLGCIFGAMVWAAAPYAASHIALAHPSSLRECLFSVRIAAVLIVLRAIESVGVSAHRAFEQYRGTVQISTAVRLLTLAAAAVVTLAGHRTVSILLCTGWFLALGAYMQFRQLRGFVGKTSFWPAFNLEEAHLLIRPGVFIWLQTVGAVVFGQLDRIILGLSLGAVVVAPYVLCIQFAQPVFGVTASALHFLFPYLSRHANVVSATALKQTVWKAFLCNAVVIVCLSIPLLEFGDRLIQLWAGAAVAKEASWILPLIVISSALMGLSVTGTYAMQALGLFRTVAIISLSGRAAMLFLMLYMLHHMGLHGLAQARLCYGAVSLLVYLPLLRRLWVSTRMPSSDSLIAGVCEIREGSKV